MRSLPGLTLAAVTICGAVSAQEAKPRITSFFALGDLVAEKSFATLKPLAKKVSFAIDRTDLVVTIALGEAKAVSKSLNFVIAIITLMKVAATTAASSDGERAVAAETAAVDAIKAAEAKAAKEAARHKRDKQKKDR